MLIKHLFLDVDGCLADFHRAAMALHGFPEYVSAEWPPGLTMEEVLDTTTSGVLAPVWAAGRAFWSQMPATEFGAQIVEACQVFAECSGAAFSLLTDPSNNLDAALGKLAWLAERMPELAVRCCFSGDKAAHAHPGALLIDDRHHVAEAFWAAGGHAIVLPQPWNGWRRCYSRRGLPSMTQLLAVVTAYKGQPPMFIHDDASYAECQRYG